MRKRKMPFLWRLLDSLGLYSKLPYDIAGDDPTEDRRPTSELKLDEILVARAMDRKRVSHMATTCSLTFALQAIGWLSNVKPLWKGGHAPAPNLASVSARTSTGYISHLDKLIQYNVLLEVTDPHGILRYISKYFAIPKSDGSARSIFNGKHLSDFFTAPPPVNIPDFGDVCRLMNQLFTISRGRGFYSYTSDIRHWFHQIGVDDDVTSFFGLCCGPKNCPRWFRWQCLPMGWSFSPRICQCLAWSLLLFNESIAANDDGLRRARRELRNAEHPPRHVTLYNNRHEEIGFITLTYDNIGVFCTDHNIFMALTNKIDANLKSANVQLKEFEIRTPIDLFFTDPERPKKEPSTEEPDASRESKPVDRPVRSLPGGGIRYLGVEYGFMRDEHGRNARLVWRHEFSRVEKWVPFLTKDRSCFSAREAAKLLGIILWNCTIRQEPLCAQPIIMEALSTLAKAVDGRRHLWDQPYHIPENHQVAMQQCIERIRSNEWISTNKPKTGDVKYLFSDASSTGFGYVLVNLLAKTHIEENRGCFPASLADQHIFLKELAAAVWSIVWLMEKHKWRHTKICIVTDNAAVYYALRAMHSGNAIARQWLQQLHEKLQLQSNEIQVFQVRSENNPADEPSRNKPLDTDRLRRGCEALCAATQGKLYSDQLPSHPEPDRELRHPVDDMENVTLLEAFEQVNAQDIESAVRGQYWSHTLAPLARDLTSPRKRARSVPGFNPEGQL